MKRPIYTKKGDKGETGLLTGERIAKIDPRVEAYGTVDELIASLGACKVFASDKLATIIQDVQERLFYIASELATPDPSKVLKKALPGDTTWLENVMDSLSNEMPSAEHFVIPGGTRASAFLHVARTVCRRAERQVIRFSKEHGVNPELLRYLNRLSDFIFVLCRYANIIDGEGDTCISRAGTFVQRKE